MRRTACVALALLTIVACGPPPPPAPVPVELVPPPVKATPAPAPTPTPTPPAPSLPPLPVIPEPALDVSLAVHQTSISLPRGRYLLEWGDARLEAEGIVTFSAEKDGVISLKAGGLVREGPGPVVVAPREPGLTLRTTEGPYRGLFVIKTGTRKLLHLINRVNLEDYLKGVVPAEMGPRVYDEIEALKAQTVAARTYAMKHRGEWKAEGYDLCATPRCQVYQGIAVEHPLTNRAVEETTGEVLTAQGDLADALFTSTCGGRTENVSVIFPSYDAAKYPYLKSVPCFGEEPQLLASKRKNSDVLVSLLSIRGRALLASLSRTGTAYVDLVAARNALRERVGLPLGGGPKTLQPAAVYEDLVLAAGFGDAGVLTEPVEREIAPRDWPEPSRNALAILQRFDLLGAGPLPLKRLLTTEEAAGLYASVLARLGDLEELDVRLLKINPGEELLVKSPRGREVWKLSPEPVLFAAAGESYTERGVLAFYPGDRARVIRRGGVVSAVVLLESGPESLFDRGSSWSFWTRRFTGTEIMARMKERDGSRQGTRVERIEIRQRGASRRAIEARVTTDKETILLSGLEIRFSLGVPENGFNVVSGKLATGEAVFTFHGRGWGHGVGLCQNGTFGMALSGRTYRQILEHYYSGAAVSRLAKDPSAPAETGKPAEAGPSGGTGGQRD